MNSGLLFSAERYSSTGYWNSWIDCQRHMFGQGAVLPTGQLASGTREGVPLGCTAGMLFVYGVVGPRIVPSCLVTSGDAGVASVSSSASVQLRLPLPPWPACTNQSRPHGVSCLSVAFFTSFCIEIEPSEQVVWLWKSPVT